MTTNLTLFAFGSTLYPHYGNYRKNTKNDYTSLSYLPSGGAQCTYYEVIALKTQKNEKEIKKSTNWKIFWNSVLLANFFCKILYTNVDVNETWNKKLGKKYAYLCLRKRGKIRNLFQNVYHWSMFMCFGLLPLWCIKQNYNFSMVHHGD